MSKGKKSEVFRNVHIDFFLRHINIMFFRKVNILGQSRFCVSSAVFQEGNFIHWRNTLEKSLAQKCAPLVSSSLRANKTIDSTSNLWVGIGPLHSPERE